MNIDKNTGRQRKRAEGNYVKPSDVGIPQRMPKTGPSKIRRIVANKEVV